MAGLVIAGVLASAMGTLSSAISSLASSTCPDLFRLSKRARAFNPRQEMFWSRAFTLFWGLALIGGAMLFTDTRNPVVELGLRIASVTYGSLLGIFFLGLLSRRPKPGDALAGFLAGIVAMALVLMRGLCAVGNPLKSKGFQGGRNNFTPRAPRIIKGLEELGRGNGEI